MDGDVSIFFDALQDTGDNNYVGIDTQGKMTARIASELGNSISFQTLLKKEVIVDSETPWIRLSILDINWK